MEKTTPVLKNNDEASAKSNSPKRNDVSDSRIFGASSEDSGSEKGEGTGSGTNTDVQGMKFLTTQERLASHKTKLSLTSICISRARSLHPIPCFQRTLSCSLKPLGVHLR